MLSLLWMLACGSPEPTPAPSAPAVPEEVSAEPAPQVTPGVDEAETKADDAMEAVEEVGEKAPAGNPGTGSTGKAGPKGDAPAGSGGKVGTAGPKTRSGATPHDAQSKHKAGEFKASPDEEPVGIE